MLSQNLRERAAWFRRRLKQKDEPARVWMRRQWKPFLAMGMLCTGVVLFDAWLSTCGFEGCPSRAGIRAFRPGEGGRILDRNDRFLGRIALGARSDSKEHESDKTTIHFKPSG